MVPETVGSSQPRDNSSIMRAERWPWSLAGSYDQTPPDGDSPGYVVNGILLRRFS